MSGCRYFLAHDMVRAYLCGDARAEVVESFLRECEESRQNAEVWISGFVFLPFLGGQLSAPGVRERLARLLAVASMVPVGNKRLAGFLRKDDPGALADFEIALSSGFSSSVVVALEEERWRRVNRRLIGNAVSAGAAEPGEVPLVDLLAQLPGIHEEIQEAMWRVLSSSSFILGEEVRRFESEFADFCGTGHAVALNSGTDALHLALRALEVGQGDGVLTVSHTFAATAESILMTDARPLFVDVDPHNCCMSPQAVRGFLRTRGIREGNVLKDRITGVRIKALLPVHLYGQLADMEDFTSLAEEYGLRILEDAAQAHGAGFRVNGTWRRAGSFGDAGAFSFYPAKNLGAWGDGGAFVTNNEILARRVKMLRNHGRVRKYEHDHLGWSSRMDSLQAAILRVKLRHLARWTEARREAAARYSRLLKDVPCLSLLAERPGSYHVYHLYVVKVAASRRDSVMAHLGRAGIQCGVHYPVPLHLQLAFAELEQDGSELPVTEAVAREVLSLPLYPEISEADQKRVATLLIEALSVQEAAVLPGRGGYPGGR